MRRYLYPQERLRTCAVAALRTVLDLQFDVHVPELVLRAMGDDATRPILVEGAGTTELRRMVAGASRAFWTGRPWKLRTSRRGSWETLWAERQAGRYALCSVWGAYADYLADEVEQPHMVVVYELDGAGDEVKIFDPGCGQLYRLGWEQFEAWWTRPGYCWFGVVV
jgi:hypothetical protein